jgi:hypothetical protein
MTRSRSRAEQKAIHAKKRAKAASKRQPVSATDLRAKSPAKRGSVPARLAGLERALRSLFGERLDGLDGTLLERAVQESVKLLAQAPPGLLRSRPQELAASLFARLRTLGGEPDDSYYLVLAAEAVRTACLQDRIEMVEQVRQAAEGESFENEDARDGYLRACYTLAAWVAMGRSLPTAIERTRREWAHWPGAVGKGARKALQVARELKGGS